MLEVLLKMLSEELPLDTPPKKDKRQQFFFALNKGMGVRAQELDPGVLLFAEIGPCPQVKKEELFSHLMRANFLGQGTGGAAIGLDETESTVTLSSVLSYDMNYKMFRDALEDFVNYIDYWRAELIKHAEKDF